MKRNKNIFILSIIAVISIILNFIFSFSLIYSRKTSNTPIDKITVSRVIDGDTFDTTQGERIRLNNINAPEYPKECMSENAKNRLNDLLLNKTLSIERGKKDNFGRTIASVFLSKILINEVLVEEGMAYFESYKTQNKYSLLIEKAQERAKQTGRGVWSSLCQTKKEGCVIKGNYRSADNTRIYHTPDCYNYDRITIKPGTTDRWFCTEQEAINMGFKKSLDCPM